MEGLEDIIEWTEESGLGGDLRNAELRDGRKRQLGLGQDSAKRLLRDLATFIASKPSQEIYRGGQERGAAWGTLNTPDELLDDPHFHDRGFWVDVEHEDQGRTVTYPGAPGAEIIA